MAFKLRDYQADIMLPDIRAHLSKGTKRMMLCASVGAGKMSVLTYIAWKSAQGGKPVYLVFHTQQLVTQACEWLQNWGARYGIEAASFGKNLDPDALIQVAMIQSIAKRLDKMSEPWLVIEDEAHHAAANTYKKLKERWVNSRFIGFSATPVRLSGELLFGGVGGYEALLLHKQTQPEWLTANGYLTPVRLFSQPAKFDLSKVKTTGGDFDDAELDALMSDDVMGVMVGDAVAEYKTYCENEPALVCCTNIKKAELAARQFREAGYHSVAIHGKMSKPERDKIMADFENGIIKVLCYCQLLGEGVDVPAVRAIFMLRPTKSIVVWLQACGRVMRLSKNKPDAFVFDHVGNAKREFWGYEMGHPSQDFPWLEVMETMSQKKKRVAVKSGELPFKRCPTCSEIHEPRLANCPHCGHDYEAARLKEEKEVAIQAALEEYNKKRERIERHKAINSLDDAIVYARTKGYKVGWAYNYWRIRNARKR